MIILNKNIHSPKTILPFPKSYFGKVAIYEFVQFVQITTKPPILSAACFIITPKFTVLSPHWTTQIIVTA